MSQLFKAKILKPISIRIGGKNLLPGDIVEVDNNTLGALISRGEAKFHEDTPAKESKPVVAASGPTGEELKTTLDERGTNYRANATKAALQELVDGSNPDKGGDNLLG